MSKKNVAAEMQTKKAHHPMDPEGHFARYFDFHTDPDPAIIHITTLAAVSVFRDGKLVSGTMVVPSEHLFVTEWLGEFLAIPLKNGVFDATMPFTTIGRANVAYVLRYPKDAPAVGQPVTVADTDATLPAELNAKPAEPRRPIYEAEMRVLIEAALRQGLLNSEDVGENVKETWDKLLHAAPQAWFDERVDLHQSPQFATPDVPPAPAAAAVASADPMPENLSQLHTALEARGCKATLVEVCAWTVEERALAKAWAEGRLEAKPKHVKLRPGRPGKTIGAAPAAAAPHANGSQGPSLPLEHYARNESEWAWAQAMAASEE